MTASICEDPKYWGKVSICVPAPDTLLRNGWTPTAIECYKRGCVCDGCFYQNFFSKGVKTQKCQMKRTVLSLCRKYGKPTKKNTVNNKRNAFI